MKNTLVDINVFLAQQQKGMINTLVEGNPLLASIPVKPSTHGFKNVFSKVTDIKGLQEVMYDEELPQVSIAFELGETALGKIGGLLPMPDDAATQMGGYSVYANNRIPALMEDAGNKQETRIYYKGFQAYALRNNRLLSAAGSTANKQFSLMAVTWNMDSTVGLYDKNDVGNENDKGKIVRMETLNDGAKHIITVDGHKCIGKEIAFYMKFGLQLADPRLVAGIVNIEPSANKLPTAGQMDDLLSMVRANTNTVLYMHPNLQRKLATEFQFKQMQFVNGVTGVTYTMDTYQNIPIVSSYNISWGGESVIAVA